MHRTYHKHYALVQFYSRYLHTISETELQTKKKNEKYTKISLLRPRSFRLVLFFSPFTLVSQAICFYLFFFFVVFYFVYQFFHSVSLMFQFHFSSIQWIHLINFNFALRRFLTEIPR